MKTKYFVRFLNRVAHYDADLELVDVLAIAVKVGRMHQPGQNEPLFFGLRPWKHPRLTNRASSDYNRKLAVAHLKKTLCAAFVKDLYEDVAAYMTDLLAGASRNGLAPDRLVGEHKVTFEANDVLKCRDHDEVIGLVAKQIFRRIEGERNTTGMLASFDKKLGLGVDDAVMKEALPFLELRHLLVHADGVADEVFCARFPGFRGVPGEQLHVTYPVVVAARDKVLALVGHYDERAVAKNVVAAADLQP